MEPEWLNVRFCTSSPRRNVERSCHPSSYLVIVLGGDLQICCRSNPTKNRRERCNSFAKSVKPVLGNCSNCPREPAQSVMTNRPPALSEQPD